MWDILIGTVAAISIGVGTYYYLNRYNDDVNELLTFVHNDMKCIKYLYRGKKYIFMTFDLECDINTIQKEIDVNSTEKDKVPEVDYKYFKTVITTPHQCSIYNVIDDVTDNKTSCKNNCTDCILCESCNKCTVESTHEILLEASKLLYAFIGPSNTYYFAFDKDFNKKLTIFMNYLFEDEQNKFVNLSDNSNGALTYGRFSALLEPEKYFDFKAKINMLKKNNSQVEWIIS